MASPSSIPGSGMSSAEPPLFLHLLTLAAALTALFFLLTNGIPLVQAGLLQEVTKKNALKTMRLSATVLFLLLAACRWGLGESRFQKLWPVAWLNGFLKMPVSFQLALFYALYCTALLNVTLTAHRALLTRAFDLGIFAQAVWNTTQGDFLYSSLKGGICLLGDHMSPLLVLLAPAYALRPNPDTLIILQVLVSAACIFFVAAIAREKIKDPFAVFAITVIYCFFLPTRNALHEDFHPEILAEPFMFAAFMLLERKRLLACSVCLLIIGAAKEGMLGVVFVLGFYGFCFKRARIWGACVMAVSALFFWSSVHILIPALSGQKYFYGAFFSNLNSIEGLLAPFRDSDRYEYALKIFGPLLCLSLFHFPTLLLTFPILFQNLLTPAETIRSLGYHYTVGLTTFVFISTIYGWATAAQRFKWMARHMKTAACLMLYISLCQSGVSEYYSFWGASRFLSPHRELVRQKLASVPAGASVLTHNNFIPQLANRKEVFMFEYPGIPNKLEQVRKYRPDYVILDTDAEFWEGPTLSPAQVLDGLPKEGYGVEFQDGSFHLFRKTIMQGESV